MKLDWKQLMVIVWLIVFDYVEIIDDWLTDDVIEDERWLDHVDLQTDDDWALSNNNNNNWVIIIDK